MASVAKRKWTHKGVESEGWVVRYTDQNGKRRLKTFKKQKEAAAFRTKVETEVEKGAHTPDSESARLSAVADRFMETMETRHAEGRRMSRHRLESLRVSVRRWIKPMLGVHRLNELAFSTVAEWGDKLSNSGRLCPQSVELHMQVLRLLVDFGIKRGFASRNIVAEVLKERGGTKRVRVRTFTREEALALLDAAENRPRQGGKRKHAQLRCMVHLAMFAGLRRGEILGLTLASLDFDAGMIRVRNSLTSFDELKAPKTAAGVRDVPMVPHLAAMMRDLITSHFLANDRGLVFTGPSGLPINITVFHREWWPPLADRAGITRSEEGKAIRFHSLRHWAASAMIEHQIPLTDVAQMLGHAAVDLTLKVYAHPIVGQNRRMAAMDGMARAMLEAPAA